MTVREQLEKIVGHEYPGDMDILAPKVEAALREVASAIEQEYVEQYDVSVLSPEVIGRCVTAGMKKLGETT